MAIDGKKLFGCPTCGFRVTGREEACPRCSVRYGKNTLFECPFCGEHVDPTSVSCPSCHVAYREFYSKSDSRNTDESIDILLTEIIAIESQQVREEDKKLSCPSCSWMLDGTEARCPKCGATFDDNVSYQCPICAALVAAEALKCDECGSDFASIGQIAEETGPEEIVAETIIHEAEVPSDLEPEVVEVATEEEVVVPQIEEETRAEAVEEPRPEPPAEIIEPVAVPEPVEPAQEVDQPVIVPQEPEPVEELRQEEPPEKEEEVEKKEPETAPAEKPKQRKLKTRKVKAK